MGKQEVRRPPWISTREAVLRWALHDHTVSVTTIKGLKR